MKVQKGIIPHTNRVVWIVLDDNYQPIEPIVQYLHYLDNVGRSPNTISSYAHNLKLFWEFLADSRLDWHLINLSELSNFIHWLRNPNRNVLSVQPQVSRRCEKTINHCLTTVSGFYEFQERIGATQELNVYRYQLQPGNKYKSFLHHISKGKEVKTRLLKIKEPKTYPGNLTPSQVGALIESCMSLRDKFLIRLLYETGLRIGEALGLRHSDMITGNTSEIRVIPRFDNVNNVRAKSGTERTVHVSKELMQSYCAYLIDEYPSDIDCDFVFVVIKVLCKGKVGNPLSYKTVDSLFRRLTKKLGIKVTPHLLRHTHATELIRAGWDMAHVQQRLGHTDIQTTINTYVHLNDEDLFQAYQDYQIRKNQISEPN